MLTYVSLLGGTAAIAAASHARPAAAGACLAAAAIADTFDGRLARLIAPDRERRAFGGQLDSLCDVAAFGIAPAVAVVLLRPAGGALEWLGWGAAFLFAACAATRLAFFNLAGESDQFTGLPAPVAALVIATFLVIAPGAVAMPAVVASAGLSMLASWRIRRPHGAGLALFVLWPVALIAGAVGGG